MTSHRLLRTLQSATILAGLASTPALAANATAVFDPAQMPATHGTVAQYDLSPRGDIDGLILKDGTEVHVPPHLGRQLASTVKPGDSVTIHGLHARAIPLVEAMSVTNDGTGKTIADEGFPGGPPPHRPHGPHHPRPRPPGPPPGQQVQVQGKVQMQLHSPRGDLDGVLLTDGTIVHMPPPAAQRLADLLAPGSSLTVSGREVQASVGHTIDARRIGPNADKLQMVGGPRPMDAGPGPGPDAPPPPPPAPAQ
ncbi:MAG: hypothetical protein HIU92_12110 [Proteobacteria bacterium]|nr:hypothetical protein [Pseudomonadota bacterium]